VEGSPVWSPDGDRILYTRGITIDTEIWFMDADGSNHHKFIDGPFSEPGELDWLRPRKQDPNLAAG
jgi:Tol biopolymer transport system component